MGKRKSLMVQLSIIIIFITTSVFVGFGLFRYQQFSNRLSKQLQQSLDQSLERLSVGLKSPFFTLYQAGIKDIIHSELKNQAIQGIYVLDGKSDKLYYGYRREGDSILETGQVITQPDDLSGRRQIAYEDEILGTVVVIMTTSGLRKQLLVAVIFDLSLFVILDVILIVLVIYFLRVRFVKPITALTALSTKAAAGDLESAIQVKSEDEIGILAQSFLSMRSSIKDQLTNLQNENLERIKAENALRESEQKYRNVVNNASEMICVAQDGFLKYFNPIFIEISGFTFEEIVQKPFVEFIHPDDQKIVYERYESRLKGEELITVYPFRMVNKEGHIRWVEIRPVVITWENRPATLNFMSDITERKKTQELMIQSEKLMSVGGLAAGMAHELNNPLGGILQGVQNLKRRFSSELPANQNAADEAGFKLSKLLSYLEKRNIFSTIQGITECGERAANIIANMLQFSRKSESYKAFVDISVPLNRAVELAGNDYDLKKNYDFKQIKIVKEFEESIPQVPCIESEIEQVILNLLKNSAQAIHGNTPINSSRITLRIRQEVGHAVIEIEDNGTGIDEATQKHIFEPFFTTKPVGGGTGLGLSVSFMIITNNHGGTMEVESAPDQGATFIIRLPFKSPSAEA